MCPAGAVDLGCKFWWGARFELQVLFAIKPHLMIAVAGDGGYQTPVAAKLLGAVLFWRVHGRVKLPELLLAVGRKMDGDEKRGYVLRHLGSWWLLNRPLRRCTIEEKMAAPIDF